MKTETEKILNDTFKKYCHSESLKSHVENAFKKLRVCLKSCSRFYLCGNGGSAADCEHIVGELLKSFRIKRALPQEYVDALLNLGEDGAILARDLEGGLPAVSLCSHTAFLTAFSNDKNPEAAFAQQLSALGNRGDVLLAISTSGNSRNCVLAALAAKAKGMSVLFLGGGNGGRLKSVADVALIVPETETYAVQELHLPIYHCLCAMLESEFFG